MRNFFPKKLQTRKKFPSIVISSKFVRVVGKMDERDGYRIFVGGLGWNTSQRHLEDAFSRYGKVLDCLVMVDRETGRPRGFGFITFADRRAMEDAIRDMHGRELDGKIISVNKAEPRLGAEDAYDGYGRDRRSAGRESYRGDRVVERSDECFKCGRLGHWARDCPSSGGSGRYPSRSDYDRAAVLDDPFPGDRDYDRFAGDRYDIRDRLDSRDGYGTRDRYRNDRYLPVPDRFERDRYPENGYGRMRDYERDEGLRGVDRYNSGGPMRSDKGNYREKAHPYEPIRRSARR